MNRTERLRGKRSIADSDSEEMISPSESNIQDLELASGKALRRLGPFLALMFAISIADRTNVGFAKEALKVDIGIGDAAYALGAGVFFIGYAIFEIPSNLILHRVGAKVWLSRIMVTWGVASASMMFTHNEASFYILRFLVGITEAGFSPGVVLYCTYWFTSKDRGKALGIYYMGLPAALVVGSALSGALMQVMKGYLGLRNWQWMFLLEGLAACGVGVLTFFYLDSRPRNAKWLTQAERDILESELATEEKEKRGESPRSILSVLTDRFVIGFVAIYFAIQVGNYGVIFYLPSQMASILSSDINAKVGMIVAIPWLCAFVALPIITGLADAARAHRQYATILLSVAAFGLIASTQMSQLIPTILAFCLAAVGFVVVQPVFWTLPTSYLEGRAAASGIAFIGSLGNLGGFVGPTLKTAAEKISGHRSSGMLFLSGIALVGAVLLNRMKPISLRAISRVSSDPHQKTK